MMGYERDQSTKGNDKEYCLNIDKPDTNDLCSLLFPISRFAIIGQDRQHREGPGVPCPPPHFFPEQKYFFLSFSHVYKPL